MHKSDIVRLRHMLDAASEAIAFTRGKSRKDLDTNRMLALSLVKEIEILGEAASRVTIEGKTQTPNLPWQDIIAMRNRLIHAYFDIDLDIVWDTVTNELPALVLELNKILSPEEK